MEYKLILPDDYKKIALPILNEWVKALRSGKYKQGTGRLCEVDKEGKKYCCLGLLSKIQGRLSFDDTVNSKIGYEIFDHGTLSPDNPFDFVCEPLPVEVIIGPYTATTLAGCNDGGLTFDQIADILEVIYYQPEY